MMTKEFHTRLTKEFARKATIKPYILSRDVSTPLLCLLNAFTSKRIIITAEQDGRGKVHGVADTPYYDQWLVPESMVDEVLNKLDHAEKYATKGGNTFLWLN